MNKKTIKQLLELSQAKLDWLIQNNNLWDDMFEVWYANAIKDLAEFAWLERDNYWTPN